MIFSLLASLRIRPILNASTSQFRAKRYTLVRDASLLRPHFSPWGATSENSPNSYPHGRHAGAQRASCCGTCFGFRVSISAPEGKLASDLTKRQGRILGVLWGNGAELTLSAYAKATIDVEKGMGEAEGMSQHCLSQGEAVTSKRSVQENESMRKRVTNLDKTGIALQPDQEWLDLEEIARVEVTSEDPEYPIEFAFNHGQGPGWRAGLTGQQAVRLQFDEPLKLRRIWLRFSEPDAQRTQQFTLRWSADDEGPLVDIIRQQWNFSPNGSSTEIEDYKVDLSRVRILELVIDPDLGEGQTVATIADWRLAG
jgi:hypothetical protein